MVEAGRRDWENEASPILAVDEGRSGIEINEGDESSGESLEDSPERSRARTLVIEILRE